MGHDGHACAGSVRVHTQQLGQAGRLLRQAALPVEREWRLAVEGLYDVPGRRDEQFRFRLQLGVRLLGDWLGLALEPARKPVVDLAAEVVTEPMRQRRSEPGDPVRVTECLVD